jgi:hypothetical protein
MKCWICIAELSDADCSANYADHPHDGHWCQECLKAYSMPQRKGILYLQQRLHPLSLVAQEAAS